jgi:hypothetical protein
MMAATVPRGMLELEPRLEPLPLETLGLEPDLERKVTDICKHHEQNKEHDMKQIIRELISLSRRQWCKIVNIWDIIITNGNVILSYLVILRRFLYPSTPTPFFLVQFTAHKKMLYFWLKINEILHITITLC